MSEPTEQQLIDALRRADAAGDTQAAQAIARRIQETRQAQRDPGNAGQQIARGVGTSLQNLGSGLLDIGASVTDRMLAPIDFATGSWSFPENLRAQNRAEQEAFRQRNESRNESFQQNATGLERGSKLVTDIGQFAVPAAKVAKGVQGAGMLGRMGAQALAAMGTDAVQQQGEGQEGIDAGRTAMTGAFAAGGEAIAPILGRIYQVAKKAIRSNNPVSIGRRMAQELNMGEISDDVARNLAKSAEEVQAGARPGSVIAEREFGFRPTRAMKTGDFADASREDLLRQAGNRRILGVDDFNQGQLDDVVSDLTGGLDSPQTAVDDIQAAIRGARDEAQTGVNRAWRFAKTSDLELSSQFADDFIQNVDDAIRASGRIVNENIASPARAAINEIQAVLRNAVDDAGSINFKKIEEARKMFSTNYSAMNDSSSRSAFRIARKQFDKTLDDVVEGTILKGDVQDIQRLKDANAISRDVFRRFGASGSGDKVGKTVENILQNGNLDDLSAALLGSAEVSSRAGVNFARAVKRTLGENAPQLNQVRQAVILKAATRKTGETAGMQRIASNFKTLMNQRRDLLNELFTDQEIAQLGRLTMALDDMSRKPGNIGRDSGTTGRAIRYLNQITGDGFLGIIPRMIGGAQDFFAASAATAPLRTTPALPISPAVAAASNPNRPNAP